MKIINNITLKTKLFILSFILILLMVCGSVFGIMAMKNNHDSYIDILEHPVERMGLYEETKYNVMGMRRSYLAFSMYSGNEELMTKTYNEAIEFSNSALQSLEKCYNNLLDDLELDSEVRQTRIENIEYVISNINFYMNEYVTPAYDIGCESDDVQTFINDNAIEGGAHANNLLARLNEMCNFAEKLFNEQSQDVFETASFLILQMIIFFIILIIIAVILLLIIAHEIYVPIIKFTEMVTEVDFSKLNTEEKKEINELIKLLIGGK